MYNFSVGELLLGNIALLIGAYLSNLLLLLFRSKFSFGWRRVFDISLGFWVAVAIFKGWVL